MRDRVRPNVEIAEAASEGAYVEAAVVVGAAAGVLLSVGAQLFVPLGQLPGATPFGARQNEVLPERSPYSVAVDWAG